MAGLVLQKRAMMQDGGLNRKGFLCRHRYRVFSGFLLCFTFSMGRGRYYGTRQRLRAPPLLLPLNCCAMGWCTCRAGNHFSAGSKA